MGRCAHRSYRERLASLEERQTVQTSAGATLLDFLRMFLVGFAGWPQLRRHQETLCALKPSLLNHKKAAMHNVFVFGALALWLRKRPRLRQEGANMQLGWPGWPQGLLGLCLTGLCFGSMGRNIRSVLGFWG